MQSEVTIHAKLKWEPNKVTETNKEIKMQTKKNPKRKKKLCHMWYGWLLTLYSGASHKKNIRKIIEVIIASKI